jgi:hypothetical protein
VKKWIVRIDSYRISAFTPSTRRENTLEALWRVVHSETHAFMIYNEWKHDPDKTDVTMTREVYYKLEED